MECAHTQYTLTHSTHRHRHARTHSQTHLLCSYPRMLGQSYLVLPRSLQVFGKAPPPFSLPARGQGGGLGSDHRERVVGGVGGLTKPGVPVKRHPALLPGTLGSLLTQVTSLWQEKLFPWGQRGALCTLSLHEQPTAAGPLDTMGPWRELTFTPGWDGCWGR